MIYLYIGSFIAAFLILFKSADFVVSGATNIARLMNIPKMIIGIVLVGFATTAPEFGVSVMAAILGNLEIALGNAVGSVICDNGIALALAAILAPTAIFINCRILKVAGAFLLTIDFLAYFLARNGTIGRVEGAAFVAILAVYYIFLMKNPNFSPGKCERESSDTSEIEACRSSIKAELRKPILLFVFGFVGIALASLVINWAAVSIAEYFSISKTIIGLTVVAIGTSSPEISTCITAARKGEGEIAVGNIIGADVLNILWIIGVSSIVNPIRVELNVINFSFPFMILIVTVSLVSMRLGCRIGRIKGIIIFGFYLLYLVLTFLLLV
jgi:cation:H+ antiporter